MAGYITVIVAVVVFVIIITCNSGSVVFVLGHD